MNELLKKDWNTFHTFETTDELATSKLAQYKCNEKETYWIDLIA